MDLIIGGAYQGKLEYAKGKYELGEEDIYTCDNSAKIDLSKRCIYHFEEYIKYLSANGIEDIPDFRDDAIVIMNDLFCGVVPIDPELRKYREDAGRIGGKLTRKAEHVVRMFCGLAQELK